jgi:hypothetical protein
LFSLNKIRFFEFFDLSFLFVCLFVCFFELIIMSGQEQLITDFNAFNNALVLDHIQVQIINWLETKFQPHDFFKNDLMPCLLNKLLVDLYLTNDESNIYFNFCFYDSKTKSVIKKAFRQIKQELKTPSKLCNDIETDDQTQFLLTDDTTLNQSNNKNTIFKNGLFSYFFPKSTDDL